MATKSATFYSVEELCEFLRDNHVSSDVSDRIKSNQINGELFLELSSDELKEIAPVLGDRVALRKLQAKLADQENPEKIQSTETDDPVPSCPILPNIEPEKFYPPPDTNHPMYLPTPAYFMDPSQSAMLMMQPPAVPALYPPPPAHTAGYNAVVHQPYIDSYLQNSKPRYVHTQFRMNDKCCLGNQFWVNIWLLTFAVLFGQFAIPFAIFGLAFACKAASLNTGEIEKFGKARVWEKRAALCGDISFWVIIGMVTVVFACTFFGIPIAIIVLVVAIPLWVTASTKENNLYKYNENEDSN